MIAATPVPARAAAGGWREGIDGLTRDARARVADRLALRIGLWLVLRAERRVLRRAERSAVLRQAAVREATAREQYESLRQHAYTMLLYHG